MSNQNHCNSAIVTFFGMVSSRDPKSRVVNRDLQRSGIKLGHFESPGYIYFEAFVCLLLGRLKAILIFLLHGIQMF